MIVGVIPARLESTRFPRKILFPIRNRPMVMHVFERALKAKKLDRLIIAVDSLETVDALRDYDAEVLMTSSKHQSGTDRIAEAVKKVNTDIVVNIQGDEPMIEPQLIDDLIAVFDDKTVKIATLASTIITEDDMNSLNAVKVKIDKNNNACGFYRQISDEKHSFLRHIGIYGYRKETLMKFTALPQSENEMKYNLEQLRAMDNEIPIHVVTCEYPYRGIDTQEDLKQLKL